jgi:glycosyltransferase 2 family protein
MVRNRYKKFYFVFMSDKDTSTLKNFKTNRIILPVILGLGIVTWLLVRDFEKIDFSLFTFSSIGLMLFLGAFIMMFFRDFGYVLRMRVLSAGELSWKQCIKIVFLWEFGSAITPSAVGGTAIATIFLWKEGLNVGKSTSIVMATSFLDELYFTIMFPLIILLFTRSQLFITGENSAFVRNLFGFAVVGYTLKLGWTLLMAYSLFINPGFFANIVKRIFRLRFLKKWNSGAEKVSDDFIIANRELKNKSFKFWFKSVLATFISWTARYWVLNFLLLAMMFSLGLGNKGLSVADHFLIFARQLIMWIIMLVMPSPGGSGFVETVFTSFMSDFVPVSGFVIVMALVWRMVTYYPYLIVGAIIAPGWLNKNFKKKTKEIKVKQELSIK